MTIFSGENSKNFWKAVSKATRRLVGVDILYEYGIKAQNMERENVKLQAENERLRKAIEAALRIKKLWLPEGVYGATTRDEMAALATMHTMFKQALKEQGKGSEVER